MRYRILGGLAVRRQSGELALDSEVQKRVLARLLVAANTPVAVEELVAAYWSTKPPDDPDELVRVVLAELRELLDPQRAPGSDGSLIELSDGRFLLAVARKDLDVFVFEDGVVAARRLRSRDLRQQTAETLRKTLDLWRGEPLAGMHDPWLNAARSRLGALRLEAMEDLYEVELACGRHAEVLQELFAATAEFPLRERIRSALMVALYRSGRQPEALQQYDDLEARLAAVHNFAPSAALRMVRDRIQAFEPFLILPVVPAAAPEVHNIAALIPVLAVESGYLAALVGTPAQRWWPCTWWPYTWWPRSRRSREAAKLRRAWRAMARHVPEQLREYGIGRPDLKRGNDDGGLVELNSAPAEVLMTIPGVTARKAALIIQSRTWWPFWSVQELQTRGLMRVNGPLRERVLILPIHHSVGGPRQNPLP